MHLLPSTPVAIPQFASLSYLLIDSSTDGVQRSSMGEPLIVCSPVASVSHSHAVESLEELHAHLAVVLHNSDPTKVSPVDRLALIFLSEDERLLDDVQVFRPSKADGLALQYRVLRDDAEIILAVRSHIAAGTQPGQAAPTHSIPPGCVGIVLCVASSGLPHAWGSSALHYSLSQRMSDCALLLAKIPDAGAAKVLLSSLLLVEDDQRKTNEMVQAPNVVAFATAPDETDKASRGLLSTPMGMISPLGQAISPLAGNVASGVASGVSTVASGVSNVASGMVNFSKANFSKRMSMTGAVGATSARGATGGGGTGGTPNGALGGGGGGDDDATHHQLGLTALNLRPSSAEAALAMMERMTVMSVAETDTFLRKFSVSGHERKANLDLTGSGKSRFRRRKSEARDPDLDGFDYKGPAKEVAKKRLVPSESTDSASVASSQRQPSIRQPRNDSKSKASAAVPTLSAPGKDSTTGRRGSSALMNDDYSQKSGSRNSRRRSTVGPSFDDEVSLTSEGRSTAHDSAGSTARIQVNIALNEDLSCSYKLSQLSTCSVEGVVQIQVKTTTRAPNPFFLLVRDPAGHVDTLQENKKFADDITANAGPQDGILHHKFAVSVPKGDNYFPVLRYKCSGDLRPVPIRVQTRVKVDGGFCRVALQISSNPNNEANLTDLTIIMGVPDDLRGDTLVTQPAGGVWNEAKRSVIWCVSELGSGEKFQLQARFEAERSFDPDDEKPKFPVLVRCQCLFAQLSSVELEVKDIPERFPADVTMKLARRFRLSHRERS